MPDFELAASEFVRQATILEALVKAVDVAASQDGADPVMVGDLALPIIPNGGQNTMAAAAIVLLAAHFEEFVRQQIEEYAGAFINDFDHLKPELVEKIADQYWKAGISKLGRIKPKGSPGWAGRAEPVLRGLIDYPVIGTVGAFQPSLLSEHDNNMRWDTVCDLTGRVGVKSLEALLFKNAPLKSSLGSPKADKRTIQIRNKINEFYELRNSIVHSISQNAGIGAATFSQWAIFFGLFTTAFSGALSEAFTKLSDEINLNKAAAV